MKNLIKQLVPPLFVSLVRRIGPKKYFSPRWLTFSFPPLKGLKIFFDPDGPWQQKMVRNKYDRWLFDRLEKLSLEGKIIYDIGAHIGFHSLYFSKLTGSSGKIVAFEPHPKNVERFRLILEHNPNLKNIRLEDVALSDSEGIVQFNSNQEIETGRSTGSFIATAHTFAPLRIYQEKGFAATAVETTTLDQFVHHHPHLTPDLLKIDVEGAEAQVLAGGTELLKTKRPLMFIEIHSMRAMFKVVTLLEPLKYQLEIIHEEANGQCFLEAKPIIL